MINKVIATVNKHNMIPLGATVVAAVSGGSDSMAMLDVLIRLKEEYNFQIIAAHVNHCLRGAQADSDEAFVADYCMKRGIEFKSLKADVSSIACKNGMSFEEAGRKVRYDFFASLGDSVIVATAHNADDRAETFLFNFTRGSSLRGLCSIPPIRDNIIRPIIDCSKAEIVKYCNDNGIPYVTDATNSDVTYSRNRIRHNVISELNKINPSFLTSSTRCIESLREDENYLSELADSLVVKSMRDSGYDCSVLKNANPAVLKRAVVRICEKEKNTTPEHISVAEICRLVFEGGKTVINGGVFVRVRKGILDFPEGDSEEYEPLLISNGHNDFYGFKVVSDIINNVETNNLQFVSQNSLDYYFDYDKINGNVMLRGRLSGDRITLKSRGCTKSLKKLFNELSIPPEKRNEVVVLSDDKGVIGVYGIGIDSRVTVNSKTERILKLSFIKK